MGSTVGQKNQLLVINTVIFPSLLGLMKFLADQLISKPSASVLLHHKRKPYGMHPDIKALWAPFTYNIHRASISAYNLYNYGYNTRR